MSILKVEHLKKVYTTRFGGQQVQALRDVNFSIGSRLVDEACDYSVRSKYTLISTCSFANKKQ